MSCVGSASWQHNLRSSSQGLPSFRPASSSPPPAPSASPQAPGALLSKQAGLFLFQLQLAFRLVFLQKRAQLRHGLQQTDPLLVVQRDGKPPQAVNAHSSFFADAEFQRTAAPSASLFLHFRNLCLEFFVSWLCHDVPSV